jgi:hypothetical protein
LKEIEAVARVQENNSHLKGKGKSDVLLIYTYIYKQVAHVVLLTDKEYM